jgi:hypothetical protein
MVWAIMSVSVFARTVIDGVGGTGAEVGIASSPPGVVVRPASETKLLLSVRPVGAVANEKSAVPPMPSGAPLVCHETKFGSPGIAPTEPAQPEFPPTLETIVGSSAGTANTDIPSPSVYDSLVT